MRKNGVNSIIYIYDMILFCCDFFLYIFFCGYFLGNWILFIYIFIYIIYFYYMVIFQGNENYVGVVVRDIVNVFCVLIEVMCGVVLILEDIEVRW